MKKDSVEDERGRKMQGQEMEEKQDLEQVFSPIEPNKLKFDSESRRKT